MPRFRVKAEDTDCQQTEKESAVSMHDGVIHGKSCVAGQNLSENIAAENKEVVRKQLQLSKTERMDALEQIRNCQPQKCHDRQQTMGHVSGEQIIYGKRDAKRTAKHEKNAVDAAEKPLSLFHKIALLSERRIGCSLIITHNDINRYTRGEKSDKI